MKLISITVSYGETKSLPEYSNTKPSITLSATLDDDDDPAEVEAALWAHARLSVQAQVDMSLELNGKAAKYDPAPRYQVMRSYNDRYRTPGEGSDIPLVVVILPDDMELDKERFGGRFVHATYDESRNLRAAHARRVAAKAAHELGDAPIIDCMDGDLDRIATAMASTEEPSI